MPAEAPYLSRALRSVLVPPADAEHVRNRLLSGGVRVKPDDQVLTHTHVIALADGADLDLAAAILRDYVAWPY